MRGARHLRWIGGGRVFTHGGHSYADPSAAGQAATDEISVLVDGAQLLREAGHDIQVLSAGSTPTAVACGRDGVTEVRAGTFVFGDRQQVMLGAMEPSEVSLAVASTVVSTAVPGQFVLDAGAKALGKCRSRRRSASRRHAACILGRPARRCAPGPSRRWRQPRPAACSR